jgi:hypothetical protein
MKKTLLPSSVADEKSMLKFILSQTKKNKFKEK